MWKWCSEVYPRIHRFHEYIDTYKYTIHKGAIIEHNKIYPAITVLMMTWLLLLILWFIVQYYEYQHIQESRGICKKKKPKTTERSLYFLLLLLLLLPPPFSFLFFFKVTLQLVGKNKRYTSIESSVRHITIARKIYAITSKNIFFMEPKLNAKNIERL